MALAFRIDAIKVEADGTYTVAYTVGQSPLPASPDGFVISGWTKNQILSMADDIDEPQAVLGFFLTLVLFLWKKNNPALSNPGLLVGKTVTLTSPTALSVVAEVTG